MFYSQTFSKNFTENLSGILGFSGQVVAILGFSGQVAAILGFSEGDCILSENDS